MRLAMSPARSEDDQELTSLYRWLCQDATVSDHLQLALELADGEPGTMGGAFDVISAIFADGSAVAAIGSLIVAYRTWRDTRRKPSALKIEKDGVEILVSSGSEQEIRRVLELVLPSGGAQLAKSGGEDQGDS